MELEKSPIAVDREGVPIGSEENFQFITGSRIEPNVFASLGVPFPAPPSGECDGGACLLSGPPPNCPHG